MNQQTATLELTKTELLLLMAVAGNCSFKTQDIESMQIKLRKLYGEIFVKTKREVASP